MVIVADDLTGACDAIAPFAARGAQAVVPLSLALPSAEVTAYSTESRDLSTPEIVRRMKAVAAVAGSAGCVFKKIDSTMRGNVRAEVDAAIAAFHRPEAVVTPAFPEMGRCVRDGHLQVDGCDPVSLGPGFLDAATSDDLDRIVVANLHRVNTVLWAGSAGLASALARALYGPSQPLGSPQINGPLIFCIGSDHPATTAQVRALPSAAQIFPIARNRTLTDEIRHSLRDAGAIFITGGDTASTILSALGARSIHIRHEIVTGVPWGMLSGGMLDGIPVVTKSGGFGKPDTLLRVAEFFSL